MNLNWIPSDDNDGTFLYSSGWSYLAGSDRQWESAVHTTSQAGATATFRFIGTQIKVFGTLPAGPGIVEGKYSIDGGAPTTTSFQCPGDMATFENVFFASELLSPGAHTLVITNAGTAEPFQLDKVEWFPTGQDGATIPLPPQTPAAVVPPSSSSNPAPTILQTTRSTQVTTSPTVSPPSGIPGSSTSADSYYRTITSQITGTNTTTTIVSPAPGSKGDEKTVKDTMVVLVTSVSAGSPSPSAGAVDNVGTTKSSVALSKEATAGVIVGSIIAMLLLLILIILLIKRSQRRRKDMQQAETDLSFALTGSGNEMRNVNLTPFDLGTQRTSAFIAGVIVGKDQALNGRFSRLEENNRHTVSPMHKSPLPTTNEGDSPHSPTSPSNYSQYTGTLIPSESGGYFGQQPGDWAHLHRRRNTSSDFNGDGTVGTWGAANAGSQVPGGPPPPSYQASFHFSTIAGGSEINARRDEAIASSSKRRLDNF